MNSNELIQENRTDLKNVLVAVDFHKHEHFVIDHTLLLAKKFDSKVWLLHVAAPNPDFVGYEVGPKYIRDNRAAELKNEHQQLHNYAKRLKNEGIIAESLLVQGETIKLISEKAKQLNIDLIIAGHHDRNFIYKSLFTDVTGGLIKESKVPILIVPVS